MARQGSEPAVVDLIFCQFSEIGFAPEWGQRKIQYLDMVPNQKDNTVSL